MDWAREGRSLLPLFVTGFRQMAVSRRSVLLLLLGLAPSLLTLLLVLVSWLRPDTDTPAPAELLAVQSGFFLRILLPLAGILFGGAVVADEVEAGTFVYLWARPVSRWALAAGRSLAAAAATAVVVCAGVLALGGVSLLAGMRTRLLLQLPQALLAVCLAALAYAALFAAFGSWFRRSMVMGLLWALVWENLVAYLPGSIRYLTVSHHARSLFPYVRENTGWFAVIFEPTPGWVAALVLVGAAAGLVALHALWLRTFELRLSGGGG